MRDTPENRQSRRTRQWKDAYDPDFEEGGHNGDQYVGGLSESQKNWVRMAWTAIWGGIHCIFPVWEGDRARDCGDPEVQLHHVTPQGEARHFLNENPNTSKNIVPLCKEHHIKGQRGKPLTREDQDVVHLDQAWASRHYHDIPNVHEKVRNNAHELVEKGQEYHVPLWDSWFRKKAERTVELYNATEDHKPFPEKKKRGVKTIRNEWDEASGTWIQIEE